MALIDEPAMAEPDIDEPVVGAGLVIDPLIPMLPVVVPIGLAMVPVADPVVPPGMPAWAVSGFVLAAVPAV